MAVYPSRKIVLQNKINFVNYVEATGTQYIDLGFVPSSNTKVVCDFQCTAADKTNRAIFGVVGQFSFRKFNETTFRTNGGNSVDFPTTISITARHTVEKTPTVTTIDSTNTKDTTAGSVSNNLFLGAYNNGTAAANFAKCKYYGFKRYEGNAISLDLRPCLDGNGVACLYDMVSDQYFYNQGSGTFDYG